MAGSGAVEGEEPKGELEVAAGVWVWAGVGVLGLTPSLEPPKGLGLGLAGVGALLPAAAPGPAGAGVGAGVVAGVVAGEGLGALELLEFPGEPVLGVTPGADAPKGFLAPPAG